jgi:hypothetical protein
MIPKIKRIKNVKTNKPLNTTKASSQTPKKFFVYYSVVNRVQKMILKTSGDAPIAL